MAAYWLSMGDIQPHGSYAGALRRGFEFAHELRAICGPVHFLVALSEDGGVAGTVFENGSGLTLRSVVSADPNGLGQGALYLSSQVQEAARSLADAQDQQVLAEHLLLAVLDQGSPQVQVALSRVGLDFKSVRGPVLEAIRMPLNAPTIAMPATMPRGTGDNPALAAPDLDPSAWEALCWRQEHLPIERVRKPSQRNSLYLVEQKASRKISQERKLDDDQLYSLRSRHRHEVEPRVSRARPDLIERPSTTLGEPPTFHTGVRRARRFPPRFLNFTVGWGTWFRNRQVGLNYRWFRLRTASYYRGAPQATNLS
jgi:hypothetical protein